MSSAFYRKLATEDSYRRERCRTGRWLTARTDKACQDDLHVAAPFISEATNDAEEHYSISLLTAEVKMCFGLAVLLQNEVQVLVDNPPRERKPQPFDR